MCVLLQVPFRYKNNPLLFIKHHKGWGEAQGKSIQWGHRTGPLSKVWRRNCALLLAHQNTVSKEVKSQSDSWIIIYRAFCWFFFHPMISLTSYNKILSLLIWGTISPSDTSWSDAANLLVILYTCNIWTDESMILALIHKESVRPANTTMFFTWQISCLLHWH